MISHGVLNPIQRKLRDVAVTKIRLTIFSNQDYGKKTFEICVRRSKRSQKVSFLLID